MKREFQLLILPILKGFYITVILVVIALCVAARMVFYTVPKYQSTGSIKIDNRNINLGDLSLFEEEGRTKGANSVDFLTEVEMFKSKRLKELTFKKLNFDIDYFRIGKIKTVELYENNPIEVAYRIENNNGYDQKYYLKYVNKGEFLWSKNSKSFPKDNTIRFNDPIKLDEITFLIRKNKKQLKINPNSLRKGDVFAFRVNSINALVNSVNDNNYFVRSVDEKVKIVKLFYQHEVPEKAALFINTLMEMYIEDCKNTHREEADSTLKFIDKQLLEIKEKLKNSESQLVLFKTQKSIMNLKQETDATLKELMELELRKINYNMQEAELERTYSYLVGGNDLRDFAPNFEALKDPIFKEAFLNVQKQELVLNDLLLKYTRQSDEVQNATFKINKMRAFLNESVRNALRNIRSRRSEMENSISNISEAIKEYPDKQQQTAILQREVKLNEELYTSLVEKRMEIAVAKSANTVFHQIVDQAIPSKGTVTPNKSLYYGVALFFALVGGVILSFLMHFLTATIKNKNDLLQTFSAPLIGIISKVKKGKNPVNALGNLYTNLELIQNKNGISDKANTVLISSMRGGEGKTFTATNLAKIYASMGKKVLVIDMDIQNPELHKWFGISNEIGLSALLRNEIIPQQAIASSGNHNLNIIPSGNLKDFYSGILFAPQTTSFIETLKKDFDLILIDAPAIGKVEDVILMMRQVDFNLMIFRAKNTKFKTVKAAQKALEEYEIPNVYGVLNGAKRKGRGVSLNINTISEKIINRVNALF